ncbi:MULTISPECIES: hypothetical protein [Acinetobacter]|uniref:ApeA N-terminal domain-containing protein n=2 Tax=Acinetobacter ursingii TaxID=108980 RepID=A0A7T9UFY4_9GAMM|nr:MULTISPECIES: hypothetical protein [Acinetobacter]ENX46818.1 hypothetical protein F943_03162 [Acinetobacter ursingii NIPH 706]EXD30204.1 hypothetical protein J500_3446 [Acinetobacter sp. 479375]QQT85072.1 hypothetical protein I6I53_08880 [Acinetobacter ursingii]HAR85021.1 hypothetical protein [Clostridium sp.]
MDKKNWILQLQETRRNFNNSTWVPLRASQTKEKGSVKNIGFESDFFGCGSVAFLPEHVDKANDLSWSDIGISSIGKPYAYDDGHYSPIDQYERNDKEPIGVHLVFEYPQPVIGGRRWILNPDLIVALGLIKEGQSWIRPEENFVEVVREVFDEKGNHVLIEIKREFLIDYLAARGLTLRLSYYRQRVENVESLASSAYTDLTNFKEQRNDGRFELLIRNVNDVFGGGWASFRVWRTDVDEGEDAPVMGPENDDNTDYETSKGHIGGYQGVRVEGEFWKDEWIHHQRKSIRVRRDQNDTLPNFVVETDGTRMNAASLNNEDIGRWLWFRSGVVNELLSYRGFFLEWYTAETGAIHSTSGYRIHFGVNSSDFITVYAYDIARLEAWEQHVWAGHNTAPDGKVSSELLMSQVKVKPASTHAAETMLFECTKLLEAGFHNEYGIKLFSQDISDTNFFKDISRFSSKDQTSLLRLAKEVIRFFSERLNKEQLRKLSTHKDKEKLGSNKLLESILADKVGNDKAREIFGVIAGVYDMRNGDAHQTSSKIGDALKLAGIDENRSYLRQGEQLISNFGQSIWWIGKLLFGESEY